MTTSGKEYWRSLEEFAQTPEFQELVERKFPSQVDVLINPLSRRRFLSLMAASLGLAGLNGCSATPSPSPASQEIIVPYVCRRSRSYWADRCFMPPRCPFAATR